MNYLANLPTASTHPLPWRFVRRRFEGLQAALLLTRDEIDDGLGKAGRIIGSLDRQYRDGSPAGSGLFAGSWGKGTAIRPPSDVDLIYKLPATVFYRFDARKGNKQSQLLQEIREVLSDTFWQTTLRGDGQVVVVAFNSIAVEIVPAFDAEGGGYITCDTNRGGCWKCVDPAAEREALDAADRKFNGNARKLIRLIKAWRHHCAVPIKSFHIERLVIEALEVSSYGSHSEFWFDWLVRDIFAHMIARADGYFNMPGRFLEIIELGSEWKTKAESAHTRAVKACACEYANDDDGAVEQWRMIFGRMIPSS